jgi:ferric-dicitrate binding protein FerR (iron transport regulator)
MEQKENIEMDELLVKYLTGTANPQERDDALLWIRISAENRKYFDRLRDIYESSKLTQPESIYNAENSWQKVKARYYKKKLTALESENQEDKRYFIREIFKYAAIITIVITLGIVGYKFLNQVPSFNAQQTWNEVEAPFGSRTVLNLADGSKVWLNAGSKLKYAVDFGNKNRDVFLTGEAYFDVKKSHMQFVVKTSHLDIQVFGTEFNVKAYPEENTIQTTLVQGAVTIVGPGDREKKKEIALHPNQSVTFIKNVNLFKEVIRKEKIEQQFENAVHENENLVLQPAINPVVYTSWKDSRWIIEGETLANLAVKLERRYNVKFQFKSVSLENYKFTGTLKDETLEQVLNLMKISAPIEFNIHENTVILSENKSFKKSYDELLINR